MPDANCYCGGRPEVGVVRVGCCGQLVRQVRDQAGSLLEYTLDRATNKVLGVRLLQAAAGPGR